MPELNFSDNHNIDAFLFDPPATHQDFKSIIHGLQFCYLAHVFRTNLIICQDLIKQFWNKGSVKKGENSEVIVESLINGKNIVVSKQIIHEALQIND